MGHKILHGYAECFIHTLELKLWHFEVSPYVSIGKPCICNVYAHLLHEVCGHTCMHTHKRDDLYPICSKLGTRLHCTVLLCMSCSYAVRLISRLCYVVISIQFFFPALCHLLEKKKNTIIIGALSSRGLGST